MLSSDYLNVAKKACEQERLANWSEAKKLWEVAISHVAQGKPDHVWATARMQLCSRHAETRRVSI